jgi:hypothetical protein
MITSIHGRWIINASIAPSGITVSPAIKITLAIEYAFVV